MVRFLKTMCEVIDDMNDLERYATVERIVAAAYVPSAICLALGSLGRSGVVPYTSAHEWKMFLVTSLYLTIANGRDVNHAIRCLFLTPTTRARQSRRGSGSWFSGTSKSSGGQGPGGGMGAQMQMGAAIALTVASLSLLNASVIALMTKQKAETELCRRQYAAAFGIMVIGATANAVGGDRDIGSETVTNMRMVVSFQHVIASAALCVGGVLMLPSMKPAEAGLSLQNSIIVTSSLIGSVFVILSSIMNYFHTTSLLWNQEEAFERDLILGRQPSLRYAPRDVIPLTYKYDSDDDNVHVELVGENPLDERDSGTTSDGRKKIRRKSNRESRRHSQLQQEEDTVANEEQHNVSPGIIGRLRGAVLQRGKQWFWSTETEDNHNGRKEASPRRQKKRKRKRKRQTSQASTERRTVSLQEDASISMASYESYRSHRSNRPGQVPAESVECLSNGDPFTGSTTRASIDNVSTASRNTSNDTV